MGSSPTSLLGSILKIHSDRSARHRRKTTGRTALAALENLEDRRLLSIVMETGVDDQQLSTTGEDAGQSSSVRDHAVAYNAVDDEYLVVWAADDADEPGISSGEFEVFGQIVTGSGVKRQKFRISDAGTDGDATVSVRSPAVTWNAKMNQYLVVWGADDPAPGLANNEHEIFGQLLDPDGNELGDNDFLISSIGGVGDAASEAGSPDVSWNPVTNEYLVVFSASTPSRRGINYQRLDKDGGETGGDDVPISGAFGYVSDPVIGVNSRTGDYFVTWRSDDNFDAPALDYQIYGQLLRPDGNEFGPTDFQVSDVNSPDDMWEPDIAYNSRDNEYFVTWGSSDMDRGLAETEMEIFGQIISATGDRTVSDDIRISDASGTGNDEADVYYSSVVWNSQSNEYFVSWSADDTDSPGVENNYGEIFGQRLDADGTEIGENDFRFTDLGDSATTSYSREPATVWNSQRNEYFVTFESTASPDGTHDVFAQRLEVQEAIPLRFQNVFNADVIFNRVNGTNDTTQSAGGARNAATNSYAQAASATGDGLPDDGYFPAFDRHPAVQLEYNNNDNGNNAVALVEDGDTFSLLRSDRYFSAIYLYGYAPSSPVGIDVEVTYADGSVDSRLMEFQAWLYPHANESHRYSLISGIDRVFPDGDFIDTNDGHITGSRIDTDVNKEINRIKITKYGSGAFYLLGGAGLGYAPETLTVTTLDDEADGDMSLNDLSLREAIDRADRNRRTTDTIMFDESLSDQTLKLHHGHYFVNGSVDIVGPGADRFEIDALGSSRIFQFSDSAAIPGTSSLSGVTLANGFHKSLSENVAGGALRNSHDLKIDGVVIRNSESESGGAISTSEQGSLSIKNSELSGNRADEYGGAIFSAGSLTIDNTTLSDNAAGGTGGAIYVRRGLTTVVSSSVIDNRADADDNASPIDKSFGIGGGIASHSEGQASLFRSIVAMNVTGPDGSTFTDDINTNIDDTSHNLIGSTRGAGSSLSNTNDNLVGYNLSDLANWFGPLANNGGRTQTHALLPGNPAIDGAGLSMPSPFDQRGGPFERLSGAAIDIGAFERQEMTVSISDAVASEDSGSIDFVITLSEALPVGQTITVQVDTLDASATAGSDYTEFSNFTFTIDGGTSLTRTLSIPLVDDTDHEAEETFGVALFSPVGARLGDSAATGTIDDDDEISAQASVDDVTVNEDAGTATLIISLDSPIDIPLVVDVNFDSGTATADDFDSTSRSVTFAVGETIRTLTVPITEDAIVEGSHAFSARLSTPTAIGTRDIDLSDTASITITDTDAAAFTVADVSVDEGAGFATFNVLLDAAIDIPVSITVNYTDDLATGDDYDNTSDTITFAPGTTLQIVTVSIIDDAIEEATETFSVSLSSPTDLGGRAVDLSDTAVATITDNDAVQVSGDVDGDDDFDANDAFLIHLVTLSGTNDQINQAKGVSPLTAAQIRSAVAQTAPMGDVDDDADTDANDSFLIHLAMLSGTDDQIDDAKGNSLLTATQIRSNIDKLGSVTLASSFAGQQPAQRHAAGSIPQLEHRDDMGLFDADVEDALLPSIPATNVVESAAHLDGIWTNFRKWIDAI